MLSRQKTFLDTDLEGCVAVVGLGGTGSPAAEYLARAGVALLLIDRDVVEESNLNRQFYSYNDIGRPKAAVAAERLSLLNDNVFPITDDINGMNVGEHLSEADIIIDCTDNFETRFLLNDYALKNRKPLIYTAAIRDEASVYFFDPAENRPCLRCIFGRADPEKLGTCETDGIVGPAAGIAGSMAALVAINYLTGREVSKKLVSIKNSRVQEISPKKRDCAACRGEYEYIRSVRPLKRLCSGTYQFTPSISYNEIVSRLEKSDAQIHNSSEVSRIAHRGRDITLFSNGRMLVRARTSSEARSIVAQLIGT